MARPPTARAQSIELGIYPIDATALKICLEYEGSVDGVSWAIRIAKGVKAPDRRSKPVAKLPGSVCYRARRLTRDAP